MTAPLTTGVPAGVPSDAAVADVPAGGQLHDERKPLKDRRALRAVARWALAAAVCGGLGAATACGITAMHRTDVPGLATSDDGRWDFAALKLPALPSGAPRPFDEGNAGQIHSADARDLLLPAPAGAKADPKLSGGWVPDSRYVSEYGTESRADIAMALRDYDVRHVAARGWTMPDGTSTRIYLLTFESAAFAQAFKDNAGSTGIDTGQSLVEADTSELDESWDSRGAPKDVSMNVFAETRPYGATQARTASVVAGDTFAFLIETRKGGAPAVPFHQTLVLQSQLLG
ncbi:hypothetical protein [Streptomyces sp. NBC_00859]|uniref:hypothetical protein n=1 Tax=Streptomyces sp. NBC_00859 TaxID=2903682 RepID=UPI00386E11A0|nr:hypothetical protein OG584_18795 [Streptomyces sp. NBC_00859]